MSVAVPVRCNSLPGPPHAMVCAPPGATTLSGETQRRNASTAVAAAELPVPEEVVGPTPRSKMRISISRSLTMRTNSTLVCCGKSRCVQISAPMVGPGFAGDGEFRIFGQDDKVRIAGGDFDADNLDAVGQLERVRHKFGHAHAGGDFDRECAVARTLSMRQTRRPASVAMASSSPGLRTERLGHPCGDAARAVAADFGDGAVGVVKADAAEFLAGPGEKLDAVGADAGIARAKPPRESCEIVAAAASSVTIRKSLPQAWALVKGINLPPNSGTRRMMLASSFRRVLWA